MSKLTEAKPAYTFDDFTLEPVYSEIPSRHTPDTSANLSGIILKIPIIAAPMNTVTEDAMCELMSENGGSAVLHRYMTIEEQCEKVKTRKENKKNIFFAIGATGDYLDRAKALYDSGARNFCIDIANGHSKVCIDAVKELRQLLPNDIVIMAGNVCSYEGAFNLANAGANVIRCGIGSGASCITRRVTGHGIPQLTAIEECARVKQFEFWHKEPVTVVADGGIRHSQDVVKALAIGADAVMIGGLLAGTSHSPGEVIEDIEGEHYKRFAGMASVEGRKSWFSRSNTSFVPEGVSFRVPYKGDTQKVIDELIGGLRVGMSFSNANTLFELTNNAKWRIITSNGIKEGNPNERMFRKK